MSKSFRKAALRVGTYHSPDGIVRVTPSRLRHWAEQFNAMTEAGQVIPMHWDHGNDLESLQPIAMDAFERKATRSAANSVGKLTKLRVAPDGQSAELEFITLTPSATEKVEANAVYVSPVIFPEWKDGAGHTYTDVITHMDLVNHPVDHSQGPAKPVPQPALMSCIRMGMDNKPYKMGDDEKPAAPAMNAPPEPMPEPESPATEMSVLGDVIAALAGFGLILPNDTTEENFLDRVRTAAIAAAGSDPGAGAMDPNAQPQQQDMAVTQPQIATMSLEAQRAIAFGERQHKASVQSQLQNLLETGKCTPSEFNAQKQLIGALKLSLTDEGEPVASSVEAWIESRKPVPAGTFWDSEEKLKRLSSIPANHPGPVKVGGEVTPDQSEINAAVDVLLQK
jgi:hypothetical protein